MCDCLGKEMMDTWWPWGAGTSFATVKNVIVACNKAYYRPLEVDYLRGDSSKAKKLLDWNCNISFKELVKEMMLSDLKKYKIQL